MVSYINETDFVVENKKLVYPEIVTDGLQLYYDAKGKRDTDYHRDTMLDMSGNKNHGKLHNFAYEKHSGYKDGLVFDYVDDKLVRPTLNLKPNDFTFMLNGNIISFAPDGTVKRVQDGEVIEDKEVAPNAQDLIDRSEYNGNILGDMENIRDGLYKTEVLSGTEIFTDKADADAVVHVEIDGKSMQEGEPNPDYPIEIHSLNDFDVVSQKSEGGAIDGIEVGGRNLFPQSGDFESRPSSFWVDNGGGLTFDDSITYNGYGTIKTYLGNGIAGSWLKLENGVEYTYSVLIRSEVPFEGLGNIPIHYHAGRNNIHQGKIMTVDYMTSYTSQDVGKFKKLWITFKLTRDADSFKPFLYQRVNGNVNIAYLKLEKGNKATDWTPAPEDIAENDNHPLIDKINLSLSEPLRSVGDVKDRLYRDTDGLWKVERNVGKKVISNGLLKYGGQYYVQGYNFTTFQVAIPDKKIGFNTSISSHLLNLGNNAQWDAPKKVGYNDHPENQRLYLYMPNEIMGLNFNETAVTANQKANQWISQNPITFLYVLATPTIETPNQELQDKLNNLRSFESSNYVYTVLNKTDILSENLKPTLHAKFLYNNWYKEDRVINNLMIYNRALTNEEMLQNYKTIKRRWGM